MNFNNEGKCLICTKHFKAGWNDFFCCEDHAMKFRKHSAEVETEKED